MDRVKYDAVCSAIRTFLHARGPLAVDELEGLVADALMPSFEDSISWYFTTVQADLRSDGEIRDLPGAKIELIYKYK